MRSVAAGILAGCVALGSVLPARAQLQWVRTFSNPSPPSGTEFLEPPGFGFAVAWVGDRPLIGAPGLDRFLSNGTLFADAGAAYVFDAETGALVASLLPPLSIGQAGHAVAEVAGRALVGNPSAQINGVGRAFLFDADTGAELLEYLPIQIPGASVDAGDRVGFAVGGACEAALVGAPGATQIVGSTEHPGAGAVIVYGLDDGDNPVGALLPPTSAARGFLGSAIATRGNRILAGAPAADGGRGRAVLFDGGTSLVLPIMGVGSNVGFGTAVAIAADALIVGKPEAGGARVQVFAPDGAFRHGLPTFSELAPGRFGSAVAGQGRTSLAGAPLAAEAWFIDVQVSGDLVPLFTGLPEAGAVYVHGPDRGLLQTLTSPVPTAGERFGASIAVNGPRVLVGAPGADGGRGAVYLFERPAEQSPLAPDQSVTTLEDTPATIALQAADPAGSGLTFSILCPPKHGTLSGTPPALSYTPDAEYAGPDAFTYRVANGLADSRVATVSITVAAVDDPPTVQDQAVTTAAGTPVSVTLTGKDPEGAPLSFRIVAPPAHGAVSGTLPRVVYTPAPGFTGTDRFGFVASDGVVGSATGTVAISVRPALAIGDATVVEPDAGTTGAVFMVTLSPAVKETVTVPFTTANGSATAILDYQARAGTLTFLPGVTAQSIVIPVIGDLRVEPTRTFFVVLGAPSGALVTRAQGIGTILDDDPPIGTSVLEPAELVASAGEPVTLVLTWTHPVRWRDLRSLDLRIGDDRDVVLWVRLDEASRTLSQVDPRSGEADRGVALGHPRRVETSMAVVYLRESGAADDGPGNQTLSLSLRVGFKPRAAGRTYRVEAFATDDAGHEQGFDPVGTVTVRR